MAYICDQGRPVTPFFLITMQAVLLVKNNASFKPLYESNAWIEPFLFDIGLRRLMGSGWIRMQL